AQQLVGKMCVPSRTAVLTFFGEKEGEASGETSGPQWITQRAQRFVGRAQVQHGAVEIAAAPQAIRDLVEQADSAQGVGRLELRQRRAVVVDRLARIVCRLAQIAEFFGTARRRGRQSRVARESGGDRLLHRLLLSRYRVSYLANSNSARPGNQ